ncbi:MAG: hypothetical protein ACRC4M_04505 [Mycoplasma sp.]
MNKLKIAFICVHNSCRSQIAEALAKVMLFDIAEIYSAGTIKQSEINKDAVRLMKQLFNIDMQLTQYSKTLNDIPSDIDIVITMGCNVSCPNIKCNLTQDWGLQDPSGKDDSSFIAIIKEIISQLNNLKLIISKK